MERGGRNRWRWMSLRRRVARREEEQGEQCGWKSGCLVGASESASQASAICCRALRDRACHAYLRTAETVCLGMGGRVGVGVWDAGGASVRFGGLTGFLLCGGSVQAIA
jgi:hypothetical protein